MILVAVLWAVYLSECFVRWAPGEWVFRRTRGNASRGVDRPDVAFWNERFAFVWASWWPGDVVIRCSGRDLNVEACRARLIHVDVSTRWLRRFAAALFLLLLFVFPLLVLSDRLLAWLFWLLGAALLAWGGTLLLFFRTYRRVYAHTPSLEVALTKVLSPLSLAVAPLTISIDASRNTHPVIAAHVLCDDEEFLRVARVWHADSEELRGNIERLAYERGVAERLLAPPLDVEPGVSQYCPRCHATYKDGAKRCADCPHVRLTPLKSGAGDLELALSNDQQTTTPGAGALPDRGDARGRSRRSSRGGARDTRRNDHRQAS